MLTPDDFSTYLADLLSGTYDCVDRISLRGYYPMGQTSGGLLTWWNQLRPGVPLTAEHLRRMAGDLGRRVNTYADKHAIPIHYCQLGDKTKHARAAKLRTAIDKVRGVLGGGTESRKEMDREWEWVGVFGVIGPDADNGSPARISGCRLRGAD